MLPRPSLKWNTSDSVIQSIANRFINSKEHELQLTLTTAADWASDYMLKNKVLQNSSTGTMWHRFANQRRGNLFGARVDTGDMAGDIGYMDAEGSLEGGMVAEFGLLTGWRDYYLMQEYGFRHESGREVPGMYAAKSTIENAKFRSIMRKLMLEAGFFAGKSKDKRGYAVYGMIRRGSSFEKAWRETSRDRSQAQIDAYDTYLQRLLETQAQKELLDPGRGEILALISGLERTRAVQTYLEARMKRGGY